MFSVLQDLRYALRVLRSNPGFTAMAVLTVAVGIGANTAIFSVVNGVLLRPLQAEAPDQIVTMFETLPRGGVGSVSTPNLLDWRTQNTTFENIAAYLPEGATMMVQDRPQRVPLFRVTSNYFDVFKVRPLLGRVFAPGEDSPGKDNIVVIGEELWRSAFAGAPDVLGKELVIAKRPYTIIGVMPGIFRFSYRQSDLWLPLVFTPEGLQDRSTHMLRVVGRLKPGISLDSAQQEMKTIGRRIEQAYPAEQTKRSVSVSRLQETLVGDLRPPLLVLMGAVAFVLLIACTNVANLLLVRAEARRKEVAMRTALGAPRARLVRQFVTESLVLSVCGAVIGLGIAFAGVKLLTRLGGNSLPPTSHVGVDWRVLIFTLAAALGSGTLFGLAPAFHSLTISLLEPLKESGSTATSSRSSWVRPALAIAEIACALVLLVGAALLMVSFARLQTVDPGFAKTNVLTFKVSLPESGYEKPGKATAFFENILDRLRVLPGVESAGAISHLPIEETGFSFNVHVAGHPPAVPGQQPWTEYREISPDYFATLKIPLIKGRNFSETDLQEQARPVAIVNQTFVRNVLPNEDPIGKEITGAGKYCTIIGVVQDIHESTLEEKSRPETYFPYQGLRTASVLVRVNGSPDALVSSIRNAVHAADASQPIYDVKLMDRIVDGSLSSRRFTMVLLGSFAAIATLLAVVGIYGVMSFLVTQSTREIGIRMALGAQRSDVLSMVLQNGMWVTGVGIALGCVLAMATGRLIAGLLYGVTSTDAATYSIAVLVLASVSLLACYLPARRATKVDPLVAIRYQ